MGTKTENDKQVSDSGICQIYTEPWNANYF